MDYTDFKESVDKTPKTYAFLYGLMKGTIEQRRKTDQEKVEEAEEIIDHFEIYQEEER